MLPDPHDEWLEDLGVMVVLVLLVLSAVVFVSC